MYANVSTSYPSGMDVAIDIAMVRSSVRADLYQRAAAVFLALNLLSVRYTKY